MFEREEEELDAEINELVSNLIRQKNNNLISRDNELHYSHGSTWTHIDATTGTRNDGYFVEHSSETSIPLSRIVDNDATIIPKYVEEMAEAMHAQLARSVYAMVGEAAEAVGNSVSFKSTEDMSEEEEDAQIIANLDALFEKIEFGIDRHGAVSYPQLHLHPDNKKMIRALLRRAAEPMSEDTERMLRQKEVEALSREAQRLRKFKRL